MSITNTNQSFSVDDIRRIRTEASKQYEGKTYSEITRMISNGAAEGYKILERVKREKEALSKSKY
jgi:hypothetical protein